MFCFNIPMSSVVSASVKVSPFDLASIAALDTWLASSLAVPVWDLAAKACKKLLLFFGNGLENRVVQKRRIH